MNSINFPRTFTQYLIAHCSCYSISGCKPLSRHNSVTFVNPEEAT